MMTQLPSKCAEIKYDIFWHIWKMAYGERISPVPKQPFHGTCFGLTSVTLKLVSPLFHVTS